MGVFSLVIAALSGIDALLPALKELFTALATLFDGIYGTNNNKASEVAQSASDGVAYAEANLPAITKVFKQYYPSIEAFIASEPGLIKQWYVSKNVAADNNVPKTVAVTHTQLAYVVKTANQAKASK